MGSLNHAAEPLEIGGTQAGRLLLDSPAIRCEIQGVMRQRSLAEHAADDIGAAPRASVSTRLATDIKAAAQGDRAKGEFKGGGMGLLSLPFLAIAALHDKCQR